MKKTIHGIIIAVSIVSGIPRNRMTVPEIAFNVLNSKTFSAQNRINKTSEQLVNKKGVTELESIIWWDRKTCKKCGRSIEDVCPNCSEDKDD